MMTPSRVAAAAAATTAATAAVAVLLVRHRRHRHGLAATTGSDRVASGRRALFFGPAIEYQQEVASRLCTAWTVESASDDPAERERQAAAATALVGGLPPANALLRQSGPSLRLLQVHFTGTD